MRRMWAAGAAIVVCLALGGPAAAQSPSPSVVLGPVRVTGGVPGEGGHGRVCGYVTCRFEADIGASDERLSGFYVLEPRGSTADGAWGRIGVYDTRWNTMGSEMPEDTARWAGEWFTSHPMPVGIRAIYDAPRDVVYPVDTIWLHGRGRDEGLSAVLRMWGEGSGDAFTPQVEGWLFPSPEAPAGY